MTFDSIHFLLYFIIVVTLYYLLPGRHRPFFLLLVSCYFYMVFVPAYILVLFFLIILDFFLGKKIEKVNGSRRKTFLIISILANLSTLFVFKYFNFFNQNLAHLANLIHWNYSPTLFRFLLPLGLSFHIFQSLSYVIEVYKGKQKAETRFGIYALYVMFFPQLVAGPIERPQHLLPQLHATHSFSWANIRPGLELMLWGFFKKIVIANNIAPLVNTIYNHPTQYTGWPLIIATILFGIQLYADFSGYSDIAVGAARVIGFDLTHNFRAPYFSKSISEFWRRWHISLSNWLKDYLYYPLIFRKGTKITLPRLCTSFIITFVLIGLWHGANWTYMIMGGLHGVYLSVAALTQNWRRALVAKLGITDFPRLYAVWQMVVVFALATFGWIFFRAQSLEDAWYIVSRSFYASTFHTLDTIYRLTTPHDLFMKIFGSYYTLLVVALSVFFVFALEYKYYQTSVFDVVAKRTLWVRWTFYHAIFLGIIFFGYFGKNPFIYFQF